MPRNDSPEDVSELRSQLFAGPGQSLLLTDLYQLNMMQAYLDTGMTETAVFEFFIRKLPEDRGFFLAAGLEQLLDFLQAAHFSEAELCWLKRSGRFKSNLLDYLADFRFRGDVHAMPEGTVFYPDEPIVRVTAPMPAAQLIEPRVINLLQFQTLIASKAARMKLAAPDRALVDFGLRRAHGAEAGLMAARASYLAGFAGTASVPADPLFGVPIFGTMAHSYIQAHAEERQAFLDFARARPDSVVLLVDTYNTLNGVRKVIEIAPLLRDEGITVSGVRLDSGDLVELSRETRRLLDDAGLNDIQIFVSGGIDEYELLEFAAADAPIDGVGIGTALTTSEDAPAFDCAYKLQEYADTPKRKRSEGKATWPGRKQVYRSYDQQAVMQGDLLTVDGAEPSAGFEDAVPLIEPVMREGERTGAADILQNARGRADRQLSGLPEALRKLQRGSIYPVAISNELKALAKKVNEEIERERKG
jgi:nicotinate phosphoribosyltransferase